MKISTIILTFNSEHTIADTIKSAQCVSDDLHIVDSYSTDSTLDIAREHSVGIVQRRFINYADQRNWAINNLPIGNEWQLHLDADERLSSSLINEIKVKMGDIPENVRGFLIPRLMYFLGKPIWHGGMFPIFHMRLFQNGYAEVEHKGYDQHFVCYGEVVKLKNPMIDNIEMSLSEWTIRHNRWSDLAVEDLSTSGHMSGGAKGVLRGRLFGNAMERRRAFKDIYHTCPIMFRALAIFVYRYICRMGFLDGKEGLIFFVLQTFWFRFLIDAKLTEKRLRQKDNLGVSVEKEAL